MVFVLEWWLRLGLLFVLGSGFVSVGRGVGLQIEWLLDFRGAQERGPESPGSSALIFSLFGCGSIPMLLGCGEGMVVSQLGWREESQLELPKGENARRLGWLEVLALTWG